MRAGDEKQDPTNSGLMHVQNTMSALNKVISVHRTVPILLDHTYVAVVMGMSFRVMDALAMVHLNSSPKFCLFKLACFKFACKCNYIPGCG